MYPSAYDTPRKGGIQLENYFIGLVIICVFSAFFIIAVKKASLAECKYTLVITTNNCENICEGVLREAIGFVRSMGTFQIMVLDMHSNDDTYEILKRLSLKYVFPLFRRSQKFIDSNENFEDLDMGENYELLALTKDTKYFDAKIEMDRIRHSSTYNTSFH